MKNFLSNIWFPLALVGTVTAMQSTGLGNEDVSGAMFAVPAISRDTVTYPEFGYRRGWTEEEARGVIAIDDSLLNVAGGEFGVEEDELEQEEPDSTAVEEISLPDADSTTLVALDSLYLADSLFIEQNIFDHWYAGLSDKERKAYDREMMLPLIRARKDSIAEAKEFKKAYRDSVFTATPRILDTYFLPDSMQYQRMVNWTHDRNFHNINLLEVDQFTDFNYRFNDYPFLRKDVNATWLGVAGSPVLYNNFFNRVSENGVSFYDAQESWSYSPATLPMYNTKTPYTELSYDGTLFESEQTASHNLHILTTQNIMPEWNLTILYDRFGGEGPMTNERTANKNFYVYTNYVGKKYLMHAGYLSNKVSRGENGGAVDLTQVRDTTIDAREIDIYLPKATSKTVKKTLFLDQQYRIPMSFLLDIFQKKDTLAVTDAAPAPADTLLAGVDSISVEPVDVTTAFIGHSSEFTTISRLYDDNLTSVLSREYYGNRFYNNPVTTHDSLGVTKLDNKLFIRLQPWAKEALVSKLDVGIGEEIRKYATFDPSYLSRPSQDLETSTYLYAGAQGGLGNYFSWNALGHYSVLGTEAGCFDIAGNATISFYPFRKARTSPVSLDFHFETVLDGPEYYVEHMNANHFRWDNSFSNISTTKAGGSISVPFWKLKASANYALLVNNTYYDSEGMACQNSDPMSILTFTLDKDLALFGFLHLDHRALFQLSSNQEVVPLPKLSVNARYYIEFGISNDALRMQLGANTFYYSKYKLPRWNPNLGVFYNQSEREYGNAPYIDLFANMKWQDVCLFVKWENAGMGWPLKTSDYFSSDGNIRTPRIIKIGVFWPFHPKPGTGTASSSSSSSSKSGGSSSGSGRTGQSGLSAGRFAGGFQNH